MRSPMARPETVEDTPEEIRALGAAAYAHRADHSDIAAVRALVAEIGHARDRRLDILVNGMWGGEAMSVVASASSERR